VGTRLGIHSELDEFAEQVGAFIQYWGFKQIHGKIWSHLFLSSRPLDAAELIGRLGVSKALISISIKELLSYRVIEKAGRSSMRTQLYQANPEVISVICGVLRQRERAMLMRIRQSFKRLQGLGPESLLMHELSKPRIEAVSLLIDVAERVLEALLALSELDLSRWKRIGKLVPSGIRVPGHHLKTKFAAMELAFSALRRDRIS
jgi:DNA-binding transcriptional regulator GbsR (MarR family)